jgi:glutathione S-transferase
MKLYALPPAFGLPSICPAAVAASTYLSLAGIRHTLSHVSLRHWGAGTTPSVEVVGQTPQLGLFAVLAIGSGGVATPPHEATEHLAARFVSAALFPVISAMRFADRDTRGCVRAGLGDWARGFSGGRAFRSARAAVNHQLAAAGLGGLHTDALFALGKRDLLAVMALVSAGGYISGAAPGRADAVAYAGLASLLAPGLDTPLKAYAQSLPELMGYVRRIRARLGSAQHP